MARRTERQWVERLRERFAAGSRGVALGIGDDAAILAPSAEASVCSVDASVQGVHFDSSWLSLEDVGYRSFQAAVSDLAAMGALPVAALSALILPRDLPAEGIDQLTLGQRVASVECACPIVGGNLSRGRELSITTTVLGRSGVALPRSGARAGDELWLVGALGLAAAGLACLRGRVSGAGASERRAVERCVQAWRRPRALLGEGRELTVCARACIDISDGLATDARQLARASRVRVIVDEALLRAALEPSLLLASRALRRSALHFALYGGEDYALLATGPSRARPVGAAPIGWVTRGQGALLQRAGQRVPLERGFDHLARR
ncbi:MAG TPA: thiamine-phosphate kinase [Polyangiaceae bacterium]|nr:thiamine-phosphate kinase [Polyangiaceae bacterium]